MSSFFSKVAKMGDRLWIQIPTKNAPGFKPGDFVLVKKITPSEVLDA